MKDPTNGTKRMRPAKMPRARIGHANEPQAHADDATKSRIQHRLHEKEAAETDCCVIQSRRGSSR